MLDLSLETIGPGNKNGERSILSAKGNTMQINLESLAKNNNGENVLILNSEGDDNRCIHTPAKLHPRVVQYYHFVVQTLQWN